MNQDDIRKKELLKDMETGPLAKFETGAVRQELDDVRYDLISVVGLRRLAETYAEGAKKYTDHNWRKGMPFSVLLNHLIKHIYQYLDGDRDEDHLAHAAWGLFALMDFEETHAEQNDLYCKVKGDVNV